MAETVAIIQSTLAPIFLVSGAAIFLNFTQARLFRVVDRLRAIGGALAADTRDRRPELLRSRALHLRRLLILRNAILFGVLVIGLTVATTLLILFTDLGSFDPGRSPIITFAAGLVCFAVALSLVTADAFLSVANARRISEEFGEGVLPHER